MDLFFFSVSIFIYFETNHIQGTQLKQHYASFIMLIWDC